MAYGTESDAMLKLWQRLVFTGSVSHVR